EIIGLLEVMWQERGLTMVVVTHDSTVARRAQRIGVMKNGRLSFKQPARAQAARTQAAQAGPSSPAGSGGLQPPDLPAGRLQPPDLPAADSVPADE
ncbi:MAG TPA: hypothetical protein VH641_01945, partial [Streptosporangiaceae bacterium]